MSVTERVGKSGPLECLKCGWLINFKMTKREVDYLLSTINEELTLSVSNSHAKKVIRRVLNRLEWQKRLFDYDGDDYPFCRHCLIDLANLFTEKSDGVKSLVDQYDFGLSIIY